MARSRVKRRAGPAAGPARGPAKNAGNKEKSTGYTARRALDRVMLDVDAPATARVSAARALAEMDGQLGKHQVAPERTADRALSRLSRDELERELGRLRALIDLGAFP